MTKPAQEDLGWLPARFLQAVCGCAERIVGLWDCEAR
jgi:hypothetical protein